MLGAHDGAGTGTTGGDGSLRGPPARMPQRIVLAPERVTLRCVKAQINSRFAYEIGDSMSTSPRGKAEGARRFWFVMCTRGSLCPRVVFSSPTAPGSSAATSTRRVHVWIRRSWCAGRTGHSTCASYDEQLQCDVPPKLKNFSSFFL